MSILAALQDAEDTLRLKTIEINNLFSGRWVVLKNGKYRGHRAQIKNAIISSSWKGYIYWFFVTVRDRKDRRDLYSGHADVIRAYGKHELEFEDVE